ncbi:protein MpATXR10 [Marchantia polymorpha subsp. ruderalis]|uniref:SET domain-containing protein n=2 Tax=Marchantia polymorpha TaxID=3197 RepID=A0A176WPW3_MARPO|nr:hypothetical protein AXG93_1487s1290 [Marchantia polymorpha subsp. ruderalis]PTQ37476.1 hypothetical protein MARPO_0057s0093 [Marchantia polymorpha]BBN16381.1 hypothetical protein Mp_7g05780 [Marchantia polymorpha subsp. ruderalis]|eukprot:PTQ37476.1 hypothetical protein MARPO_0057s0093 [Marchantia polymorpha]
MAAMLLETPSDAAMRRYYDKLASAGKGPGLRVDQIGGAFGKGLFADKVFDQDELVLREPKLVGAQHEHNKADALVCSFCFQYIGSMELQIGRRLLSKGDESAHDLKETGSLSGGEEGSDMDLTEEKEESENGHDGCGCDEKSHNRKAISTELVDSLLTGDLHLPYSDKFPLSPITSCPGGCAEDVFCSDMCADEAWRTYHSLLCAGPNSLCENKKALAQFKEHACDSNDIFLVAAQVIAGTILQARNLKNEILKNATAKGKEPRQQTHDILLEAWEPFAMGFKKLWWEAVALPDDVDPSQEDSFRDQFKELAIESLNYLKEAIYEEEYDPLFDLEVYGHIIGMFELNNLEIVVPSPVEDYFIYIDDLPKDDQSAHAGTVTRPFLDALGSEYATYCTGTGFFALQSCVNHSCRPNAKAFKREEDRDGAAVLLAIRPIRKGEEITISYIDENHDLEERQALLADYGFVCSCSRCIEDSSMKIFSSRALAGMLQQ